MAAGSVRYLFMQHGKLLSTFYLFETSIQKACKLAGLIDARGRGSITAHRFRHTVDTQLAERGAKLHTIMKVLGHTSVSMTLVYAQVSDREVLRDYQTVLAPGATIAGPAEGATLRCPSGFHGRLAQDQLLQDRTGPGPLPAAAQEGPCECDLYLTCAKFVTTPAYAPRLRARRKVEQTLAADATARGWAREVERHQCTVRRLEKLLADLGEPFEDDPHAPTAELLALHPNGDADGPPIDEGALT